MRPALVLEYALKAVNHDPKPAKTGVRHNGQLWSVQAHPEGESWERALGGP